MLCSQAFLSTHCFHRICCGYQLEERSTKAVMRLQQWNDRAQPSRDTQVSESSSFTQRKYIDKAFATLYAAGSPLMYFSWLLRASGT